MGVKFMNQDELRELASRANTRKSYPEAERLREINERLEATRGDVLMNQKTYDSVTEKLDFVPSNLKVNNHLADNQMVVVGDVSDYYKVVPYLTARHDREIRYRIEREGERKC
jgi:hypothetical protein